MRFSLMEKSRFGHRDPNGHDRYRLRLLIHTLANSSSRVKFSLSGRNFGCDTPRVNAHGTARSVLRHMGSVNAKGTAVS